MTDPRHPEDREDRARPRAQAPERGLLERDDARFVERLASHYAPPPLEGARRTAFDARLRARLDAERHRHRGGAGGWPGVALAGAAAAALAWLVLAGPVAGPDPAPTARAPEEAGPSVAEAPADPSVATRVAEAPPAPPTPPTPPSEVDGVAPSEAPAAFASSAADEAPAERRQAD